MFSWLKGSKKKEEDKAKKYEAQLSELASKGFPDRAKNLEKLEMYNGDVSLVLMDYDIEKPSSTSVSPEKNSKAHPKQPKKPQQPPQQAQPTQPTQPTQATQAAQAKQASQPSAPSVSASAASAASAASVASKSRAEREEPAEAKAVSTEPKGVASPAGAAESKDDVTVTNEPKKAQQASGELERNLMKLTAYDVKQIVYSLGSFVEVAEILFSFSVSGETLYNFVEVEPILKRFNQEFGNKQNYESFLQQCEQQYKSKGILDKDAQLAAQGSKPAPHVAAEEKSESQASGTSQGARKDVENLDKFVSSEVREVILERFAGNGEVGQIMQEFADRLYSRSVNGSNLMSLDYEGAVWLTSISPDKFSKKLWNLIVSDLKLPQSGPPFDAKAVEQLGQQQQRLFGKLQAVEAQIGASADGADVVDVVDEKELQELSARWGKIETSLAAAQADMARLQQTVGSNGVQMASQTDVDALRKRQIKLMNEDLPAVAKGVEQLEQARNGPNGKAKKTGGKQAKQGKQARQQKQQKQKQKKQAKQGKPGQVTASDALKQLEATQLKMEAMQDAVDKLTLSPQLYEMKQKQVAILNTLRGMATKYNLPPQTYDDILESALDSSQYMVQNVMQTEQNLGGRGDETAGLSKKQLKKLQRKKAQEEAKKKGIKLESGYGSKGQKGKKSQQKGQKSGKAVNANDLKARQDALEAKLNGMLDEACRIANKLGLPLEVLMKIPDERLTKTPQNVELLNEKIDSQITQMVSLAEKAGVDPAITQEIVNVQLNRLAQDQASTLALGEQALADAKTLSRGPGTGRGRRDSTDSSSSHLNVRGRRQSLKKDAYPSGMKPMNGEDEEFIALKPKSPPTVKTPFISVTNEKETHREAIDVKKRRKSLRSNVVNLRKVMQQMDVSKEGALDDTAFRIGLQNMHVEPDSIENFDGLKKDVMEGENFNYSKFCDYLDNPALTSKFETSGSWDAMRKDLIGVSRQEGKLRIVYRYDAWPVGQSFQVDGIDTTKNELSKEEILQEIEKERNEKVACGEIRYAQVGPVKADKVKWNKVAPSGMVPLRVAKDGWLEADVWMKTKQFLDTKQGLPFPH